MARVNLSWHSGTPTLGTAFARGGNNFDALRLGAALLVLFSHAFVLTGQADAEPVARLLGHTVDGGGLAVSAFFAISGFLVTRSAARRRPLEYVRARVLRIWPALAVAVLVQTVAIGPACTDLPWRAYLLQPQTWGALVTASIVVLRPDLPGVFAGNPVAGAVNGSLWTLRVELACYLLPLCLVLLRALRPRVVLALAAAALLAFTASAMARASPHGAHGLGDPRLFAALACLWDFLFGAGLWLHRDRVPCGAWPAAVAAALTLLAGLLPPGVILVHLAWPYLMLCAGLSRPVGTRWMHRLGDVSYGVYLYAFPVQQAVVAWRGAASGPLAVAAMALPAVLVLALLSSRIVERPALRLKFRPGGMVLPQG